jgi:hypothetical protein
MPFFLITLFQIICSTQDLTGVRENILAIDKFD